ncbi:MULTISPECIES: retron system putative HNH endonuclease [unclassified Pantoea]|uniref:retron system putative HNH endonuclease n=1 Tax=unclassified Pantoea TaxID=2630326 RepID=UPI001CD3C906|nr:MULTISPECIES: retron system putative HNH endonuclease [unclassified Pantoea]MCA1179737.1 TIGR02646 family protein [Pantoea sp. alder69]MCA1252332.1 TIGR02646 family protein [Pantoea sp. alder70]MCA1268080.1 TIGR02646 family protein [Pantoea sp. alder81]
MIKLNRPSEPKILCDNAEGWTQNLMELVKKYGDYKSIPKAEKEAALKFYRHEEIRTALRDSSSGKCAFCEGIPAETGFAEVEHFHPKSLYTDKAFEWNNLLYSCKACNNSKLSHDTQKEPIINPYDLDPRDCFTYTDVMIQPGAGVLHSMAEKTIAVCGLSGKRLISARAAILASFRIFEVDLREALDEFDAARTATSMKNKAAKISDSLCTIEQLTHPGARLSGYCSYLLENSAAYHQARQRLQEYTDDTL